MRRAPAVLVVGALALALAACVPTPAPTGTDRGTQGPPVPPTQPGEPSGALSTALAYQADGKIQVLRPGEAPAALTQMSLGAEWHADWSPDGTRIAFAADGSDGARDVWIATSSNGQGEPYALCDGDCIWVDYPAWSPAGDGVLVARAAPGKSTIEFVTVQGSPATELYQTDSPNDFAVRPRWSQDGNSFVVEIDRYEGTTPSGEPVASWIRVVGLDGTVTDLTDPEEHASEPDWGVAGVVFRKPADAADPDGPSDLYLADPAGGEATAVTSVAASGGSIGEPTWIPDGRIAAVLESGGAPRPVIVDQGEVIPVEGIAAGTGPRVSP